MRFGSHSNARSTSPDARPSIGAPSGAPVNGRLEAMAPQADSSLRLRLILEVRDGWHIGSPGGRGGVPTRIAWAVPNGWSVTDVRWPPSTALAIDGDTAQVLSGTVRIDARVDHPFAGAAASREPISAVVTYGACRDICRPGRLTVTLGE